MLGIRRNWPGNDFPAGSRTVLDFVFQFLQTYDTIPSTYAQIVRNLKIRMSGESRPVKFTDVLNDGRAFIFRWKLSESLLSFETSQHPRALEYLARPL
jgi:hypothetical protein